VERVIFPGGKHAVRMFEARLDMAERKAVAWRNDGTGEADIVVRVEKHSVRS